MVDKKIVYEICKANPDKIFYLLRERDFYRARAFWGNKKSKRMHFDDGSHYYKVIDEGWQYHLRDMVLEAEPLKYMERFL